MKAIRMELSPDWLSDGAGIFRWNDKFPRFTFYKEPTEFARSLMMRYSVEGEEKEVVKVLFEIAESEALTRRIHELKPFARETEEHDPLIGRYKRLRFPHEGGVILEGGRYGLDDSVAYGRTGDDESETLVQMLVERGVVRPTASLNEVTEPRGRGGPPPPPTSGPSRPWL